MQIAAQLVCTKHEKKIIIIYKESYFFQDCSNAYDEGLDACKKIVEICIGQTATIGQKQKAFPSWELREAEDRP